MRLGVPKAAEIMQSLPLLPSRKAWWNVKIGFWAQRTLCRLIGHRAVKRAWVNAETKQVAEYHCGCMHCDLFWIEFPDGRYKTTPKHAFKHRRRLTLKRMEALVE